MTLSQKDFFKHMESRFTWAPFLKVTNLCNNFCAHCCERSGPNCEPKFIELDDIKYILENFKYIKNFSNYVTITGGEPTMAYTAKSRNYIPQILRYCGINGYDVYLNTNARWILSENAEKICSDFNDFVQKYKSKFLFRLSLDRFHDQAIDANAKFINWVVKNENIPDERTGIYMFFDKSDIIDKLLYKLACEYDIKISDPIYVNKNPSWCSIHKLNGTEKMLCITEYQGIVNIGRAKDNNIATKQPFSKTEIYFSPFIDTDNEICFDSNGYAMLSANDDDTIKTPYHSKRGKVKPIHIIKQELFDQAYKCLCSENQL